MKNESENFVINNAHCKDIKRVLIVEDSLMLQGRIRDELSIELKLKCDVAATQKEARELLAKNSYDLLIVDISLPDGNEDFIYSLIRKKYSIIVITASSNEEQREKLVSLPIVDYLYKTDEYSVINYLVKHIDRLQKNRDSLIVVADDSSLARHQVTNLLKTQNTPFIEMENGLQVLKYLEESQHHIGLLITDINMPKMSGLELIRKIRLTHDSFSLPILAYSSPEKASTIAQLIKTGANDFISKPINNEEFIIRLSNTLELSELFKRNKILIEKLNKTATTDFLTSLYNRNSFYQNIKHIESQSKRNSVYYGIIMIDIDNFKQVNDNYGHKFGDTVLQSVAATIKESARSSDMPFRWGGEEFIVLVLNTSLEELARFAQRIRKNIEKTEVSSQNGLLTLNVTVSCGVSIANDSNVENVENVIKIADERLYIAKESGKNRVVYKSK